MLFTCYFAKVESLPRNVVPVSISAKAPSWYRGAQCKRLAPGYELLMEYKRNHDCDYYIEHFNSEVLGKLDAAQVVKELQRCIPDEIRAQLSEPIYSNEDWHIALICYEKPSEFCHRHLVAKWLSENGFDCKEWEFDKEMKKEEHKMNALKDVERTRDILTKYIKDGDNKAFMDAITRRTTSFHMYSRPAYDEGPGAREYAGMEITIKCKDGKNLTIDTRYGTISKYEKVNGKNIRFEVTFGPKLGERLDQFGELTWLEGDSEEVLYDGTRAIGIESRLKKEAEAREDEEERELGWDEHKLTREATYRNPRLYTSREYDGYSGIIRPNSWEAEYDRAQQKKLREEKVEMKGEILPEFMPVIVNVPGAEGVPVCVSK